MQVNRALNQENETQQKTACIQSFLKKMLLKKFKKQIFSFAKIWKTFIPCLLTVLTVCINAVSFLSYDLHPDACLAKPGIDTIEYIDADMRVAIRYTGSATVSQRVSYEIVMQ